MKSGYDIDFQLRTGEAGKIFYVPENWYFYRIHSSSITHTQSSLIREFFAEVAHTMQRQRRISGQDDLQRGFPPSKPNDAWINSTQLQRTHPGAIGWPGLARVRRGSKTTSSRHGYSRGSSTSVQNRSLEEYGCTHI